ncbi:hypothetical protein JOS77_24805 [Chromobacterium haemolyticum]|nr:hypothetical protein JOS77_24805 [Chromobacterium haemolyticum]
MGRPIWRVMASAQSLLWAISQSTAWLIKALRSASGVARQPAWAARAASSAAWVWTGLV